MSIRRDLRAQLERAVVVEVIRAEASDCLRIQVHGLGYIGLPTSLMFMGAGHEVVGVDPNQSVVRSLNEGAIHLHEEGLQEYYSELRSKGGFRATTTAEPADVFIVAVPTPALPGLGADLSYVQQASREIASVLQPENLVILESTVPPGTCANVVGPEIEAVSGLRHGRDYGLAHCPERVIPGRILVELVENERIVGGTTPEAAARAAELYRGFVKGEIHVTDATTAELAKVMENTFRDVNIALANEFRRIAASVGADPFVAIELANRHPRVNIHQPGIGVGGHCIPVDPWFLVEVAPDATPLVRLARAINDEIPSHVAKLVLEQAAIAGSKCIGFFGLSYKPDVDDFRESPAARVVEKVAAKFAGRCLVVEPFAQQLPGRLATLPNVSLAGFEEARERCDVAVTLVRHRSFCEFPAVLPAHGLLDFARIWTDEDPLATDARKSVPVSLT